MSDPVSKVSAKQRVITEIEQALPGREGLSEAKLREIATSNNVSLDTVQELYGQLEKGPETGTEDYQARTLGGGTGVALQRVALQAGQKTIADNPLLSTAPLPRFDAIEPEHVEPAMRFALERAERALAEIEANAQPTWKGIIEPLNRLGEELFRPWGVVGHLMAVKNSDALREAHAAVQPDVVAFGMKLSQSRPIYEALVALRDGPAFKDLDTTQQRILTRQIQSAELSGVGLTGAAHTRFKEINLRLAELGTQFGNNLLDVTKAYGLELTRLGDVAGLPADTRAQFAAAAREAGHEGATAENGPWRIGLDGPSYVAFMKHAKNRPLREELYRAYMTRASSGEKDNSPLIREILSLRREQARLLGFESYADVSLSTKMAESPAQVAELTEKLRQAAFEPATRELQELIAFARSKGAPEAEEFANWDVSFWAERVREEKLALVEDEVRQYLPFEKVLGGLFGVVERLFGVTIQSAEGETSVWNDDVRYFNVVDKSGQKIASFYLDPFARPADKRGGAWMDEVVGRSRQFAPPGQDVRLPTAYVVCNGTPPVEGKTALMTFREMQTLFHEMGHALQHMLTTIDYDGAAGISNVEWDAVELPSQFMENFCYHEPTLKRITAHAETGEPMPDDMIQRIIDARTFLAGIGMLRQLNFGKTDMALHTTYDPDGPESPFDVQRRIAADTSVLPPIPEDRFLNGFSHIFKGGYAAGYYSYKWAEVLSADAFAAFEEAGLNDPNAVARLGALFRDTVLSLGGSMPAMDVFKLFRGREPTPDALLRHSGLSE